VLVDAPCSGEGMFRSDPGEVSRWTPRFTTRSAAVQDEILWFAGKLVRPGGVLVYSTCTFNQVENEGSVARFLEKNSQYSIDPIPDSPGFSSGINLDFENQPELKQTTRIWPHLAPGEGHYIARLIRSRPQTESETDAINHQVQSTPDQIKIYRDFFKNTLQVTQRTRKIKPDSSSLALIGNQLYHIPPKSPSPSGLRVLRWGWLIGTVRSNRFVPSPALALGLSKKDVQMMIEFPLEDRDLKKYLSGSPIANSKFNFPEKAWILVTVEGFPLGWGKLVQGRIKSHFPVWLRAI
jgi:NOL1/NOP2/fmu family ribosome biogenesis protein